jgi:hypothetical protein
MQAARARRGGRGMGAAGAAALVGVALALALLAAPAAAVPSYWVSRSAYSANACTTPTSATLSKHNVNDNAANT